jgi:hypothetical protein
MLYHRLYSRAASSFVLDANLVNDCYNAISAVLTNCANTGGTKTHGGSLSGTLQGALRWKMDPVSHTYLVSRKSIGYLTIACIQNEHLC